MQPVVHATTRTPGPSTVEPVVKEWRNPRSPDASAARTSASDTRSPRSTRSSNGLAASSEADSGIAASGIASVSVERPVDHVHLLLAREPDEVHRIARDADRQARVLLGMIHRIE